MNREKLRALVKTASEDPEFMQEILQEQADIEHTYLTLRFAQ